MLLGYCLKNKLFTVSKGNVTIIDKGSYYQVNLDFKNQVSHKMIGQEYGAAIREMVPKYESLVDSYLSDIAKSDVMYNAFIERANDIKPQIDKDYRDELEGMASSFSSPVKNVLGDGKLSLDELYVINLLADVSRGTQCSALGVYGNRSETNHTIAGRIMDWNPGSQNQIAKIQSSPPL